MIDKGRPKNIYIQKRKKIRKNAFEKVEVETTFQKKKNDKTDIWRQR